RRGGPVVVAPGLVGVLEHRGLAPSELAREQVRHRPGAAVAEGRAAPPVDEVRSVALVAPADPGGGGAERRATSALLADAADDRENSEQHEPTHEQRGEDEERGSHHASRRSPNEKTAW